MLFSKNNLIEKAQKIILCLIILAGVTISIVQFCHNRSLWLDDAMLALNFVRKDFLDLFSSLEYAQSAPILFLLVEKLFWGLIPSELGLRLFPLICYFVSLGVFIRILWNSGFRNNVVIFSIAVFVFNPSTLYFSNEVKQYMSDMAVAMVLYYLYNFDPKNFGTKKLMITGAISIFLSNITPVILAALALDALYKSKYLDKIFSIRFFQTSAIWFITFCCYYFAFIFKHPLTDFMVNYWGDLGAFMPKNIFSKEFIDFLSYWGLHVFIHLFDVNFIFSAIFILLFIIGIIGLFRDKNYSSLILFSGPIVIHLLLSAYKLYPVSQRLLLYLLPFFILIISNGLSIILSARILKSAKTGFGLTLILTTFLAISFFSKGIPLERVELKQTLQYINDNGQKGDLLFVCFQAAFSYQFYVETGQWNDNRFHVYHGTYMLGNDTMPAIARDVNRNNWLIFSDFCKEDEIKMVNEYKNSGFVLKDTSFSTGSRAYKFQYSGK